MWTFPRGSLVIGEDIVDGVEYKFKYKNYKNYGIYGNILKIYGIILLVLYI